MGEPFCVSEIFLFENFLDIRGITVLPIVFVSQCRKLCGEPFNDSNKLGHPEILCIKGDFHNFPLKNLSLTRSKNIAGERFVVSKQVGYRKLLCIHAKGWRGVLRFSVGLFFVSFF